MRRVSNFKFAVLALAGCAVLAAAFSALASIVQGAYLSSRLEALEGIACKLGASIGEESARLDGSIGNLGSKLGEAIAAEGASDREAARAQAESLRSAMSRAAEGRDGLLSGISLKLDRLGEKERPSGFAGAIGDRSEELLRKDVSLARCLEDAERCFASGRYADAAARYSAVLASVPGEPRIRARRALSLFRANPGDSSAYGFIESELAGPSSAEGAESLDALASISIERQDWGKALGYLDRLMPLEPRDAGMLKKAGECALYAGDGERALGYLESAGAISPGDGEIEALKARARSLAPSKEAR